MVKKPGKDTGIFGEWLDDQMNTVYKNLGYSVFYDHGDRVKNPNVVAIKGIFGDTVSNVNRLADIDVLVVNKEGEVVLLIEIEERGMSPKKLIGDIFTILMCNRIAIKIAKKQEYFAVSSKTKLIIAGVVPPGAKRKIETVIKPQLKKFHRSGETLQSNNVKIVYANTIMETLDNLKNEMMTLFQL